MRRREFLSTILAGATLAATWQAASASGIGTTPAPVKIEDKGSGLAPAMKGFGANDESPDTVNPLNPEWMYIEFGSWCWDMNHQYNCKWALHLGDQIPSADDVAQAIQHPSYEGWWLTLNEPDLANMAAKDAADLVQKQMQVVMSVDPNAKFCVGLGSQLHAPNTASAWFPKVWKLLPKSCKSNIKAFHTHYYAQCEPGLSHDGLFTADPIRKFVQSVRTWVDKNSKDFRRELWITEIGLVMTDDVKADPRVTLYPLVVQDAMNGTVERWAWYSESTSDGYATLCQPHTSTQTSLGNVFAAMQSGIYPLKQKI